MKNTIERGEGTEKKKHFKYLRATTQGQSEMECCSDRIRGNEMWKEIEQGDKMGYD